MEIHGTSRSGCVATETASKHKAYFAGQYNNWMEEQLYLNARTPGHFHCNDRRCDLSPHTILNTYQDEQWFVIRLQRSEHPQKMRHANSL